MKQQIYHIFHILLREKMGLSQDDVCRCMKGHVIRWEVEGEAPKVMGDQDITWRRDFHGKECSCVLPRLVFVK